MTRPLFDVYLAVDWSARSAPSPARPSPDSVWVAEGASDAAGAGDGRVHSAYLRTRHECERLLRRRLLDHVDRGRRVLVGFDFPFGYPRGFAAALGLVDHDCPAPWRLVWDELDALIEDAPDNDNNRFEVAAALNQRCAGDALRPPEPHPAPEPPPVPETHPIPERHRLPDPRPVPEPRPGPERLSVPERHRVPGPLWGCPRAMAGQWIQPTSPGYPYRAGQVALSRLRWAEQRAPGTQPAWKLMGIGSAGSQCLLGIPVVSGLRSDPGLREVSAVWPFETGFAGSPGAAGGPCVLFAEVWPGIVRLQPAAAGWAPAGRGQSEMIKDEAQVRLVVRWLRSADGSGILRERLVAPQRLPVSARHDVLTEEGWILGV